MLKKHKNEGYTSNSIIGRSGIEATYEKELYCNWSNYRYRDWNFHVVQRKLQSNGNSE